MSPRHDSGHVGGNFTDPCASAHEWCLSKGISHDSASKEYHPLGDEPNTTTILRVAFWIDCSCLLTMLGIFLWSSYRRKKQKRLGKSILSSSMFHAAAVSLLLFLVCDIILGFIPTADTLFVFSKASRLIANFCIMVDVLMLAVDPANQEIYCVAACIMLVAPLGVTIGYNARYHMAWEAQEEDTLSCWRKYTISDASFCILYLLIAVDILLSALVASFRKVIPRRQAVCLFVLIVPELLASAGSALVIAVKYRDSVYALLMVIMFAGVMLMRYLNERHSQDLSTRNSSGGKAGQ